MMDHIRIEQIIPAQQRLDASYKSKAGNRIHRHILGWAVVRDPSDLEDFGAVKALVVEDGSTSLVVVDETCSSGGVEYIFDAYSACEGECQ